MSSHPVPVPSPAGPLWVSGFCLVAAIGLMVSGKTTTALIAIFLMAGIWLAYLLRVLLKGGSHAGHDSSHVGDISPSFGHATSHSTGGWFGGSDCSGSDSGGGDCSGGGGE